MRILKVLVIPSQQNRSCLYTRDLCRQASFQLAMVWLFLGSKSVRNKADHLVSVHRLVLRLVFLDIAGEQGSPPS